MRTVLFLRLSKIVEYELFLCKWSKVRISNGNKEEHSFDIMEDLRC